MQMISRRNRTGKRLITVTLLVTVLLWGYPAASADLSAKAETAPAGQVVVLYEDGQISDIHADSKGSGKQDTVESAQEKILDEALDDSYTIDDTIVLDAADETEEKMVMGVISSDELSTEELVDTLQSTEGIRYAEPNFRFYANKLPDWSDTFIKDSWQLGEKGINADKAPAAKSGGNPIVIAVMDSGIAYDHPDLVSRMWSAPAGLDIGGEHGRDFISNDNDPYDEDNHGTHCAGIIAAAANNAEGIAGISGRNNVELMAVRVLDEDGGGDFSVVIKAFEYLIEAKKQGVNIKAVNCSFGAEGKSSILDTVIDRAGENGILTIAAAGNESQNNDANNYIPSNSNSRYVVSVAAIDDDGSLASYSNFGKNNVDVAAPGSNILSTVLHNNYAPFLYEAARVRATTQVYGEFGGANVSYEGGTGIPSVTPVSGTGHDGKAITGVGTFGASKMYSILLNDSHGRADLSITGGTEKGAFQIGNNQKSLRWTIKDAGYGDKFILFFPYTKVSDNPYVSMVLKTHSDFPVNGGGDLKLGDVVIYEDGQGGVNYHTSAEETRWVLDTDRTYNSLWHASGENEALYDMSAVSGLSYGSYGLGLVYEAWDEGDFYVDISSIAISSAYADESTFGAYGVASGTSMAAPVVTGAAGLIASARPDLSAEALKDVLIKTTKAKSSLAGKCQTGASIDFAAYGSSVSPKTNTGGNTVKPSPGKTEGMDFVWSGKKLTSSINILLRNPLPKAKTPKKFKVKSKKGKAALKWKKVKGVNGYLIFRKTGKGRFVQIARLPSGKKSYIDKTVKKGKKYQYLIVSYKSVNGSNAVCISPASKVRKLKK